MTRPFLFVALLALLTTPLWANEQMVRFADQQEPESAPMLQPFPEGAAHAEDLEVAVETSFEQTLNETSFQEALNGEASPSTDSKPTSDNHRDFHPVCDCNCSIPSLDRWCDWDVQCCTTNRWVDHPCQCSQGNCYLTEDGGWVANDAYCDVGGPPGLRSDSALRFGWWGTSNDGSPTKTGEFQDLQPSPFWDVDAISSDGARTLDVVMSQLDSEANDARLRYYAPNASGRVTFQRYLRRLDHDPLTGYDLDNPAPPGANDKVVSEDLNVGEDYAIRVQQLDAKFQGRLADNLKVRLNLWGQRKFGERQANATAHCFNINAPAAAGANGNKCHVLSQSQTIDWLTMEIQPVVEAKFDDVTVEYSRTMRSFGQNDGTVDRMYTRFGFSPASGVLGPDYQYALVPENFTQIDRLKIGATLTDSNQFYGNLFYGDTKNEFRDTHRTFDGFDLRLMNTSFDNLDVTSYVSRYAENNELPTTFLTAPPRAPASTYDRVSLRHPVDYTRTRVGLKGKWEPFGDPGSGYPSYGFLDETSLAAGYEYYLLERDFAVYNTTPVPPGPFVQPDTITHQMHFGPTTRWSRRLETFTRYKVQFIQVPLIGVSEFSDEDPDVQGAFNSSQPEQVHAVEIGGTCTPTDNFMVTTQFTIENSWHYSQYANFSEDNYPVLCTIWYAPTQRLSLTSGYAYTSNWIDQDVTLGTNRGVPTDTSTTRWNYAGENHLVSFNASYAWTARVQLVAGYEWNRGSNAFSLPALQDGADWSLLPSLSDVIVETNRVTAGVDWQPYRHMDLYFRYIYFDYGDISSGLNSGTSHMALTGAGVNW
jgi:hypothetical protein